MDPHLAEQFVTLDPDGVHQRPLCQLVIRYTREYLE